MLNNDKLRISSEIVGIISCLFSITIFALDVAIINQVFTVSTIVINEFNDSISLRGIGITIIVLGAYEILIIIINIISIVVFKNSIHNFAIIHILFTFTYLSINLTKESLLCKFINCFNYYDTNMIKARTSLLFVLLIFFLLTNLEVIFDERSSYSFKERRRLRILISTFIISIITAVCALNILILASLKTPLNKDIGPQNIQVGFFNQTEIYHIKNGLYNKSNFYDYQVITKLSDIIYSEKKDVSNNEMCMDAITCISYNNHELFLEILCTNTSQLVYEDCKLATKIRIKFSYIENGPYPKYNCAVKSNDSCSQDCPHLTSNYKLFMIQTYNKSVETAWNGLCNCINRQPTYELNLDRSLNACVSFVNSVRPSLVFVLFYSIYVTLLSY